MTIKSVSALSALALMLTSTAFYADEAQNTSSNQNAAKINAPLDAVKDANHPAGWAISLATGLMMMDNKLTNETTGFNIHYKNNFKRIGLGIAHYWTWSNKTVVALGLDLFAGFGSKKVESTLTMKAYNPLQNQFIDVQVPAQYYQKRPFSALAFGKLGYTYGNFVPFLMIGVRESYIRHISTIHQTGEKRVDKDVAFSFTPGAGFMYKMDKWAIGAEYMYGGETTFGLDAYAEKVRNKSQSAIIRLSRFF